jgi:hypothetical protein
MGLRGQFAGSAAKNCCFACRLVPYWLMPLWLSIPVVAVLWLSSWISGLDLVSGSRTETYVIWIVTAVASALLAWSLVRRA